MCIKLTGLDPAAFGEVITSTPHRQAHCKLAVFQLTFAQQMPLHPFRRSKPLASNVRELEFFVREQKICQWTAHPPFWLPIKNRSLKQATTLGKCFNFTIFNSGT
jgi:hypothetical protein